MKITKIISIPEMELRRIEIHGMIFLINFRKTFKFQYAAIDKDGSLYLYSMMPELGFDAWIDYEESHKYIGNVEFDGNWEDSVIWIDNHEM